MCVTAFFLKSETNKQVVAWNDVKQEHLIYALLKRSMSLVVASVLFAWIFLFELFDNQRLTGDNSIYMLDPTAVVSRHPRCTSWASNKQNYWWSLGKLLGVNDQPGKRRRSIALGKTAGVKGLLLHTHAILLSIIILKRLHIYTYIHTYAYYIFIYLYF